MTSKCQNVIITVHLTVFARRLISNQKSHNGASIKSISAAFIHHSFIHLITQQHYSHTFSIDSCLFIIVLALASTAAASDENASMLVHSKTPSQLKTPKRRAFGDISNRKPTTNNNYYQTNSSLSNVNPATTKPKPSSNCPRLYRHRHRRRIVVKCPLHSRKRQRSLAKETTPQVELSAGRTWSEQQDYLQNDDDDDDIADIWKNKKRGKLKWPPFVKRNRLDTLVFEPCNNKRTKKNTKRNLRPCGNKMNKVCIYCMYII